MRRVRESYAARVRGFFAGGRDRNLLKGSNSGFTFDREE